MLVDCAAYGGGCRIADVPLDDIDKWVGRDDTFIWVGLYEPTDAELDKVQSELALHELAVEDARRAHQRPKLEEYGQSLFVVLRTAQWNETNKAVDWGETHLFIGRDYVVSVRHGESPSYAPVRGRCQSTPHLLRHGTGFVLYAIMDYVVDHYFAVIDGLEDQMEELEEAIFGGEVAEESTQRIYQLKRQLIAVKRAVAPLIEVCNRLVRFDQGLITDVARPYFRDIYDHVVRINESVDSIRDALGDALEANLALVSIRQNETMKGLAAWAGIIAVPTMLAGIWGMNFEVMPELKNPYGYPMALTLIFGAAAFLYWRFKKTGWL